MALLVSLRRRIEEHELGAYSELILTIDELRFARNMIAHGDASRSQGAAGNVALDVSGGLPGTDDRAKWSTSMGDSVVLGWIAENRFNEQGFVSEGIQVGLILDKTCFYAEQGGQVGDTGIITTPTGKFDVAQTLKLGSAIVHVGEVAVGRIEAGQKAWLKVNPDREFTRKNHTATHLLHWTLHKVLGEHVEQHGSKVKPDEFTFDFSHTGPLTDAEKAEVERLVRSRDLVYAAKAFSH